MRALVVACALMGVLIVAGVAALATIVVRRGFAPGPATGQTTLQEPPGTRIVGASGPPEALAVVLSGAGPDRVVVLDTRRGTVLGRVALAR